MYTAIRKLHLYAGLVILVFLMMYFVSGYVLIHRPWFSAKDRTPQRTVRQEPLTGYSGPRTPEALAHRLRLRGRINASPDQRRFTVVHPGEIQQVALSDDDQATITTTREDLAGILVQLHRVHGYGGGWLWNAFVLFNDLAGVACILFALTGVYLWWKTAQRKTLGVICLAISCLYGGGMILYTLFAR